MIKHPTFNFERSNIENVSHLLSSPKRICIITHVNPDGDAIGSSLALYNLLLKQNHEVAVLTPNEVMGFLKWMKGSEKVLSYTDQEDLAVQSVKNAEVIFCLDFNNLSRVPGLGEYIEENINAIKILIDHHLAPKDFCDIIFSTPDVCATAELIFYLIQELNFTDLIDKSIAECLYCGIMTDSGNFRFNSVTPELHEISAELLRRGVEQNEVYSLVFDSNSINTVKFHGFIMAEKLEYISDANAVIISLSKEELLKYNVGKDEIDDTVNFGLKINGVRISALFYEDDNTVKVSLRSKGNLSVRDIASNHFNGGGHLNAAGGDGDTTKSLEEAVADFKRNITQN